jgi:hypothetical protein
MKKKNPIFFWLWIAVIALAITGLVKHFHIKNFNVIDKGILYTSGQPRGMDYTRLLYKYHIATFINLRVVSEHRGENWYSEEAEWMKSTGVKYIELPIDKSKSVNEIVNGESLKKFMEIMGNKINYPVLLHDSSGQDRVAYLAGVWMLKSGYFNLEQTIKKTETLKKEPLTEEELAFFKSVVNSQ